MGGAACPAEQGPARPRPDAGRLSPAIPLERGPRRTPRSLSLGSGLRPGQEARPPTSRAGCDPPLLFQHFPLPPPLAPGIGVTSVLGTRALGTRWCLTVSSFVSPSPDTPSWPRCPPPPPALGVGRGKGGHLPPPWHCPQTTGLQRQLALGGSGCGGEAGGWGRGTRAQRGQR